MLGRWSLLSGRIGKHLHRQATINSQTLECGHFGGINISLLTRPCSNNFHQSSWSHDSNKVHPSVHKKRSNVQQTSYTDSRLVVESHFGPDDVQSKDKIPANYSLVYMFRKQRMVYYLGIGLQASTYAMMGWTAKYLYENWHNVTALNFDIASGLYCVYAVLSPTILTLLYKDRQKYIIRIYKDNTADRSYIAVKPHWILWTKKVPFTGEDIMYVKAWEESIPGVLKGNVKIKNGRYRLSPVHFRDYADYNDLCDFAKLDELQKEK